MFYSRKAKYNQQRTRRNTCEWNTKWQFCMWFLDSTLCECHVNGAAMCYWEEESEYMRQNNTTLPPWALLNINTRQHSGNVQTNTPMYCKKEVRAASWNAGIIQTLDLVERDEIVKTVKSSSYKIPCCFCSWEIARAAISLRTQKWRTHQSRPAPRCPLSVMASIKEEPLKTH